MSQRNDYVLLLRSTAATPSREMGLPLLSINKWHSSLSLQGHLIDSNWSTVHATSSGLISMINCNVPSTFFRLLIASDRANAKAVVAYSTQREKCKLPIEEKKIMTPVFTVVGDEWRSRVGRDFPFRTYGIITPAQSDELVIQAFSTHPAKTRRDILASLSPSTTQTNASYSYNNEGGPTSIGEDGKFNAFYIIGIFGIAVLLFVVIFCWTRDFIYCARRRERQEGENESRENERRESIVVMHLVKVGKRPLTLKELARIPIVRIRDEPKEQTVEKKEAVVVIEKKEEEEEREEERNEKEGADTEKSGQENSMNNASTTNRMDHEASVEVASIDRGSLWNDACSICLNEFGANTLIRLLPCRHGFHSECVDSWLLEEDALCPVCKQECHPDINQVDTV
ncbi:uncharacterized protein VTP21DRAFT_10322 [Calcarisporiella thermophila]|uniref:uncharacterized protein n=1 Tax=Calcarisporiella thermophila TaxID=911321 RepID=UPI0037437273